MSKNGYKHVIFPNGRIVMLNEKDYINAIEAEKEILIVCNCYSGGYTRVLGAEKTPNYLFPNESEYVYNCYGYSIGEVEFDSKSLKKFYKVIFTPGIKVYMKTNGVANTYYNLRFTDWETTYESYQCFNDESEVEFEKLRTKIDVEKTIENAYIDKTKEEREEIEKAIRDVLKKYEK